MEKCQEHTQGNPVPSQGPKSTEIAKRGVKTGQDFAQLMSALMSDLVEGRIAPDVANATCNAAGRLLKVVEMQYRYGVVANGSSRKTLELTAE